jgi:hypothetical protein
VRSGASVAKLPIIEFADRVLGREGRLSTAVSRMCARQLDIRPKLVGAMRRLNRAKEVNLGLQRLKASPSRPAYPSLPYCGKREAGDAIRSPNELGGLLASAGQDRVGSQGFSNRPFSRCGRNLSRDKAIIGRMWV